MTPLERIGDGPLFRPLDAGESAMIRGGAAPGDTHTYVLNADGTVSWHVSDSLSAPIGSAARASDPAA